MTIRIYCPYFPYPLREASWQTMLNQAKGLSEMGHKIELVSWKSAPYDVVFAVRSGAIPPQWVLTLFYSGQVLRGDSSYWLKRKESNNPPKIKSRIQRVFLSLLTGVSAPELFYYDPEADLRRELPAADMEIYHYSFAYAWLRKARSSCRTVVHFHNLESDLFALRSKSARMPVRQIHQLTSSTLYRHELELNRLSDEIWQHSQQDLEEFSRRGAQTKMRLISPTIDPQLHARRQQEFNSSSESQLVLGFIGGLDFDPNFQSLKWIVEKVAPLLREQQFSGVISQVGKQSERIASEAAPYSFVKLEGFVENVEDWWKSLSFLLVPDVTSAGVRMKILEALGSNVPVIANEKAIERLHPLVKNTDLLIRLEDPRDWCDFIMKQKPQEFRRRLSETPMIDGLKNEKIYDFLRQGIR